MSMPIVAAATWALPIRYHPGKVDLLETRFLNDQVLDSPLPERCLTQNNHPSNLSLTNQRTREERETQSLVNLDNFGLGLGCCFPNIYLQDSVEG